jgi:hypothetical protein
MRFTSSRSFLTALTALLALALPGPIAVGPQSAPFKSRIDVVPLTVTVTDPAGNYVAGLTGTDFTVFEDAVRQPVSFVARTNAVVRTHSGYYAWPARR